MIFLLLLTLLQLIGVQAMGDWCSEEQLLAFGREGDSFLMGGNDIRRPKDEKNWVDALALGKPGQ